MGSLSFYVNNRKMAVNCRNM